MSFTDQNAEASELLKERQGEAKETEQKAPPPQQDRALLGVETAQTARVQQAAELSRAQEGVDRDMDQDPDHDRETGSDLKDDFAKNVDALLAEFHIEDTKDPKKNFFLVAERLAHEVETKYKVPWQVCLAQACLESGYGEGMNKVGREGYVIFGIKADRSYEGSRVTSATKDGADLHDNVAQFRGYTSIRDAFDDYGRFLTTKSRYKLAFDHTDDPPTFLLALQQAGYFEDPKYIEKVGKIGNQYGFHFFESKKSAPSSAPVSPEEPEEEEKHWYTELKDFFSESWDKIKSAVVTFFAALGFDVGKNKKEENPSGAPLESVPSGPLNAELGPEWKDKLEDPDAPFFSLPKGVKGTVTSTAGLRENPFKPGELDDHSHAGIDFAAPDKTPVRATHSGKVVEPYSSSTVTVRGADGIDRTLRHASKVYVTLGQEVKAGDLLLDVGSVGRSTGPHLHIEARRDGRLIDPTSSLAPAYQEAAKAVAAAQKAEVAQIQAKGGESRVA
jgi:flagellum-specific peptidoglycan hydrolase FlgJ/murein DD-endopeptidase MepM/ murein hydrolase activator NlpD